MIIKSFELEKIISLNFNIHLIYGNNEGIKQDIISNFYKKNYEGEVLKYDEQDILTNKDEFISSLLNKSLFETEKLIIISRGTDKLTTVIDEVLERKEIEGVTCFVDNKMGYIYNKEVIKIGQVENGEYKLFLK